MIVQSSKAYKRDLKKLASSPEFLTSIEYIEVMYHLLNGMALPAKYFDHALSGEWQGFRDCHIKNDLVLVYKVEGSVLQLARLNTHSEVFG